MSKKVFLDTCIWMELCVLSNPQNSHEIAQSAKATQLLSNIIAQKNRNNLFRLSNYWIGASDYENQNERM